MSEYEKAVAAYNQGCDAIRALEQSMGEAPEAWYARLELRYQQAAQAEAAALARGGAGEQRALFAAGTGRRWS